MEIILLIDERNVAIQSARVTQNRDVRTQAKACLLLGRSTCGPSTATAIAAETATTPSRCQLS